jgi:hypothetical protein
MVGAPPALHLIFEFDKRRQLFIRTHNETLSIAARLSMLAVSLRNQIIYPGRIGSEFGNVGIFASETVWLRVTCSAN